MRRSPAVVLVAVATISIGLLACTSRPRGGPAASGAVGTNATPRPYVGQIGDTVQVTGTITVLFGDPLPDPVTGHQEPGFTLYFLWPDDPRVPVFTLIPHSPQPVLSQAISARPPLRVNVAGTLLEPIPPP